MLSIRERCKEKLFTELFRLFWSCYALDPRPDIKNRLGSKTARNKEEKDAKKKNSKGGVRGL